MNRILAASVWISLAFAPAVGGAGGPPYAGPELLAHTVRQHEEQFVRSLFEVYGRGIRSGDPYASTAIERFFRASSMEEFSVWPFAEVVCTPRLNNLLNGSRLDAADVASDLISVLYAMDQHARRASEYSSIGPVFYKEADIPMTPFNQIDRKAIEAMDTEEREAVLYRIREIDRNGHKSNERLKAMELHPQIRETACRFYRQHLAALGLNRVAAAVARRTKADEADIRAWLADFETGNDGEGPDRDPG
jgi:hypothetical protein